MPPDVHLRKMLLYDPVRRPREWTECLSESEVAVFISEVGTGEELDWDGTLVPPDVAGCCYIAASLYLAEQFSRDLTRRVPRARCEIFDRRGRAAEPLAVFVHPSLEKKEREDNPRRAKFLIVGGVFALCLAPPLFYLDWTRSGHLLWPSLLAVNCFGLGLRLLFWGNGILQRRKKKFRSQAATG